MIDLVLQLRLDLQLSVLQKMSVDSIDNEDLAMICGVSIDKIQHIMKIDVWPLDVCLFLIKKLGLQVKVVFEEM